MDFVTRMFSFVCGQASDRSHVFGDQIFPLCERCMGIYAGAALASIAWWLLRMRASRLLSTLLIVQMVPCGLHWCLDTPVLRTLSGAWFGFGLIGLLLSDAGTTSNAGTSHAVPVVGPALLAYFLSFDSVFTPLNGDIFVVISASGFFCIVTLIVNKWWRFQRHSLKFLSAPLPAVQPCGHLPDASCMNSNLPKSTANR